MKDCRVTVFAVLTLSLAGCGMLPPSQEMSDARQRLKAAYALQADKFIPFYVAQTETHLNAAQADLEKGSRAYRGANFHAHQAKLAATQAYQYALQFHATQQAIALAEDKNCLWRDTQQIFQDAIQAAAQQDMPTALKLSQTAQQQAQEALLQVRVEKLRYQMHPHLPELTPLSDAQLSQLKQARQLPEASLGVEILPGVYSEP